jgi:hypothetical protein
MMQILHLADDDRGAMFRVVSPDGGSIGRTPLNGDLLGHAVPADRLEEEAHGRRLVARLCEEEITRLAALIHPGRLP